MIQNYKIVTLCGSTRFKEQFLEAKKTIHRICDRYQQEQQDLPIPLSVG
jgi:hypothetical protein